MLAQTLKLTLALLILALASPAALAQQAPPPAVVRTSEIVSLDMARTINTPGSVMSRNDAQIAAEASGRITFIAEPGDEVEEGGLIAQMDDRQARIELESARARHARAAANASYQNAEAARYQQLAENGTVPATRLREVELARDLAVQDARESRSALDRAELVLERTQIRAPFSGRVAERLIQVGELSAPGRDIARLVDIEHKEAVAQVPVAVAPYLRVGMDVTLSLSDSTSVRAPIRAIIPVGDAVSRTFEVRIDLEGSDWIIGSAARVALPTETPRTQLAAPYDAVILRANGNFVFVVDDEDIAHQVAVAPGVRTDGYIAIDGEVEIGQRVVVSGAETLSEGRTVSELGEDA
ncbi:efflux RND transporter periplasmic adaptor subunit [uncultured Maricaulis sp.]|uniref:efflux RND transporter periplasmic adaptor subunit n=1 Tax=uncultured Maricaulis sp. TaxID=174710 RepID=UPI0026284460|nr:efflux RND transporter periplasmic adaptor subunit [uncultured Maricaulis sp.]